MRKSVIALALCVLAIAVACAIVAGGGKGQSGPTEPVSSCVIGFYNVENLFDTVHDAGKSDYEFLPDGQNHWTEEDYRVKLGNIASVIDSMAQANGQYHVVLGLAEVENARVLKDLVAQEGIASVGYRYVHHEGPDGRGIDVALLYDPSRFSLESSKSIPFTFRSGLDYGLDEQGMRDFRTRDILQVRGSIDGEEFAFFVAHLPSRRGDKSSVLRERGAEIIHEAAIALQDEVPGIKIVVMGDMNDNPTDASMSKSLHGLDEISKLGACDFFDPFVSMFKAGYGSEEYHDTWNLFDIIMVNKALTEGDGLTIQPIVEGKYYGRVFRRPFLTQQEGKYAGTPYRTFSGGEFIGGYSDHYPTYIRLSK